MSDAHELDALHKAATPAPWSMNDPEVRECNVLGFVGANRESCIYGPEQQDSVTSGDADAALIVALSNAYASGDLVLWSDQMARQECSECPVCDDYLARRDELDAQVESGDLVHRETCDLAELLSERGFCCGWFDSGLCADDGNACLDCWTKFLATEPLKRINHDLVRREKVEELIYAADLLHDAVHKHYRGKEIHDTAMWQEAEKQYHAARAAVKEADHG